MQNQCEKCEFFKDVFGNFVQCIKTGRFIDYEYWYNIHPIDCPLNILNSTKDNKNAANN